MWLERGGANDGRNPGALRLFRGRAGIFFGGLLLLCAAALGCGGKSLEEEDCRLVGNALRDAWRAEVRNAPKAGPSNDKGAGVAMSEGDKVVNEWLTECRALRGTQVSSEELSCLQRAKSLAEMRACAK